MQYQKIQFSYMQYHAMNGMICIFYSKIGNFWQLRPYNGLTSSRMGTLQKTKGIQSNLRIWGCFDRIESGPTETKKMGYIGEAQKNQIFGPIFCPKRTWTISLRLPCNAVNTKRLSFRCPIMIATIFFQAGHKNLFQAKKQCFWTPKGPLWAIGATKRPAKRPNDHLPENQSYPELPQDMGDL